MKGVIDIGAHRFEEEIRWRQQGAVNFILFEPIKANFEYLQKATKGCILFNIALANYKGYADMYVDPDHDNLSASLLMPTEHYRYYPNIKFRHTERVQVDKLDNIPFDRTNYDHIRISAQGMELTALRGGENTLKHINTISSQVFSERLYEGSCVTEELVDYLYDQGFDLIHVVKSHTPVGSAEFKRRSIDC